MPVEVSVVVVVGVVVAAGVIWGGVADGTEPQLEAVETGLEVRVVVEMGLEVQAAGECEKRRRLVWSGKCEKRRPGGGGDWSGPGGVVTDEWGGLVSLVGRLPEGSIPSKGPTSCL